MKTENSNDSIYECLPSSNVRCQYCDAIADATADQHPHKKDCAHLKESPQNIAARLLTAMDEDNLGHRTHFPPYVAYARITYNHEASRQKLIPGIQRLLSEGCDLTSELCEFIIMEDQDSVEERMAPFPAYKELDRVLTEIFEKGAQ